MLKKLIKITIGIIFLFTILAVVVVTYYQFDDDLNPEAVAVLNYTPEPIEPKDNGYYYLLGLFVEKDKEPLDKGLDIVKKAKAFYEGHEGDSKLLFFVEDIKGVHAIVPDDTHKLCPIIDKACLGDVRNRKSVFAKLSNEHVLLLDRFRRVYQFKYYRQTDYLFGGEEQIYKMHKIALMDVALKWVKGDRKTALMLLDNDIRFQRKLLSSDVLLITKMIAVAMVTRDLKLLSTFISDCQGCDVIGLNMKSLNKPLSVSELSLRKVFGYEYRYAYFVLSKSIHKEMGNDVMYTFFYKENSTLNTLFNQHQDIIALSECDYGSFLKCEQYYEQKANMKVDFFSWAFLNDPIGYVYLRMVQTAYAGYAKSSFQVESMRRLVVVKNLIYKTKIPKDRIQDYLNKLPENLKDPFTGTAVKWDTGQNLLTMNASSHDIIKISVEF